MADQPVLPPTPPTGDLNELLDNTNTVDPVVGAPPPVPKNVKKNNKGGNKDVPPVVAPSPAVEDKPVPPIVPPPIVPPPVVEKPVVEKPVEVPPDVIARSKAIADEQAKNRNVNDEMPRRRRPEPEPVVCDAPPSKVVKPSGADYDWTRVALAVLVLLGVIGLIAWLTHGKDKKDEKSSVSDNTSTVVSPPDLSGRVADLTDRVNDLTPTSDQVMAMQNALNTAKSETGRFKIPLVSCQVNPNQPECDGTVMKEEDNYLRGSRDDRDENVELKMYGQVRTP